MCVGGCWGSPERQAQCVSVSVWASVPAPSAEGHREVSPAVGPVEPDTPCPRPRRGSEGAGVYLIHDELRAPSGTLAWLEAELPDDSLGIVFTDTRSLRT